ncbi:MAG: hypothetical protein IT532_01190 [Burkholderiales bacterium]|nr:hypothetical protein [Burkholderiales bacterium]
MKESTVKLMQDEVFWYLKNGKHGLQRIGTDTYGYRYLIGDWSWNRKHPDKEEHIERQMAVALHTSGANDE